MIDLEEIKKRNDILVPNKDIQTLIAEVERLRETWQATRECVLRAEGRAERAEAELVDCQYWHGQLDEKHEALKAENQCLTERVRELEEAIRKAITHIDHDEYVEADSCLWAAKPTWPKVQLKEEE